MYSFGCTQHAGTEPFAFMALTGFPLVCLGPRAWHSPFLGMCFPEYVPVGAKRIIGVFVDPRTWIDVYSKYLIIQAICKHN